MGILLTGVTGFLGSQLAKAFIANGYDVVGLKRSSSDCSKINDIDTSKLYLHDVDDSRSLHELLSSYDLKVVIHAATNYGKNSHIEQVIKDNELFALEVLKYALETDIAFINTHSSLPALANPYSISKNNFLRWAKFLASNQYKQGCFINIILEHFYGYNDNRFVDYLIKAMWKQLPFIDLTAGKQQRDFIYIKDVISAYLIILQNIHGFNDKYNDISLGLGKAIAIKDLAILIKNLTNNKLTELRFGQIPYRKDELMYSCADNTVLEKLGWRAHYSLEDGLLDCLKGYTK